MSDTPETDEELAYRAFGFYTMGGLPTEAIKPSFARELERERDRYQDQADALVEQLIATQERMIDAERERDAAQKAMGDARDVLLDAMPDANAPTKILAEMIVAERNEARSDLEFRRGLYKLQTEQLNNANLRVERTRAYLEEIKSERDLWKLEAERWREIK